MIKLIKQTEKYIKLLKKQNPSSIEIIRGNLQIYFMILGYFSYKNDLPFYYGDKDILNKITEKICKIADEKYDFFGSSNNCYYSFKNSIYRISNGNILNIFSKDEIIKYFDIGYKYANYLSHNSSIMDYLLGFYSAKEQKLVKYLYK